MHSSRLAGFGLATLSGSLWFLACTPFDAWPLAWIAAVPMLLAIDRAANWKTALLLGWWAGVVETAGGFYWLLDTTMRFTAFPWLVAASVLLLFCATRAIIFLLFTAMVRAVRGGAERRRVPMVMLAPPALVVAEFVVPQIFPCGQWITQAWQPLVIQVADLTGPWGVSALLMMVNGALYDFIAGETRARHRAVAAAGVLAAALTYGAVRMRQVDAMIARAPRLEVGLVQPNFAYTADGDMSSEEALRELAVLQQQSVRLAKLGARLLVWSEGSYPVTLPRAFTMDFPPDSPAMIRRGFDIPVVIGANTQEAGAEDPYNSALLLDSDGKNLGVYDKVRLLAFGEYIPGIETFPWLRDLLPPGSGRFKSGAGPKVLTLPSGGQVWRLGPVICYEDLLPGFVRRVGRLHPDILVNLTSDQWFGARAEPWEHLALSVFAAVELRVPLVRAVNSGISAMVDPNGRVRQKTYANDPYREPRDADGLLVSAPKMAGGHTLFTAWGPWFVYVCGAALIVLGWRARRRAARDVRHRSLTTS